MLFVLSPAKTLDFSTLRATGTAAAKALTSRCAPAPLLAKVKPIVQSLQKLSKSELADKLSVSSSLAALNHERYATFELDPTPTPQPNRQQVAGVAYHGDAYRGLDMTTLTESEALYVNRRLLILSALYGLLRPTSLMQPYRLEFPSRKLAIDGQRLYTYWGTDPAQLLVRDATALAQEEKEEVVVINVASKAYFDCLDKTMMKTLRVITIVFHSGKGVQGKTAATVHVKRARGLFIRWAAQNNATTVEDLHGFDLEGYGFEQSLSGDTTLVFSRLSNYKRPRPTAKTAPRKKART